MSDTAYVTLAAVKTRMGLSGTGEDDLLNGLIAHSAARLSAYCHRVFTQADTTEYINGTGSEWLWLKAWPISAFTGSYTVRVDSNREFAASSALVEDTVNTTTTGDYIRYREGEEDGYGALIRRVGVWPAGFGNVKVIYQGGYATGSYPTLLQEASHRAINLWYPILKRGVGASSSSSLPGGGSSSFVELALPKDVLELVHEFRRETLV